MLCLLGVMLSVLCLVSPAPHTTTAAPCPATTLLKETIHLLQNLNSKGSSEIAPLNNTMEAGENAATYLERFTEVLKNSKESEKYSLIIANLQKIQSCTKLMSDFKKHHWTAVEEYDFFNNLEHLLRFLGTKASQE